MVYAALLGLWATFGVIVQGVRWHGNAELHTLIETVSTLLALMGSAIALTRYYTRKTAMYLLLGSGLLGAALLDGYHATITSSFLSGQTASAHGIVTPWSGVAPRVFLSLLLFFGSLASKNEAENRLAGRIGERGIYAVVGASTLACFFVFTLVPLAPLYTVAILHRPADLLPSLFFGLAAMQFIRKGTWKTDTFDHWLILSLIAAMSGHLFCLVFSGSLYDAPYFAGHLLKLLSLVLVLVGLHSSVFAVFRSEVQAKEELRRSRDEMEIHVQERTRELSEQGGQLGAAHAEAELFLTSIPSVLIGVNALGQISRWNPVAAQIFGISESEAKGRTLDACGIRWLSPDIRLELSRWLQSDTLVRCGDITYEKDGKPHFLGLTVRPIPSPDGEALITGADITERRAMEAEILHLAAIVEASDAAIVSASLDGQILSWNPAAERMYGYSPDEVRGRHFSMIWPPEHVQDLMDILKKLGDREGVQHREGPRLAKDGTQIIVSATYSPLCDASGKVVSAFAIAQDITERKFLERQLAQAQKLESIGQLAAGIAHEINTPIQYVSDNIRFLRDSFARLEEVSRSYDRLLATVESGSSPAQPIADVEAIAKATRAGYLRAEIPKALADSLDGVERVAEIVRAIKEFSHPGPLEKTPLNLNRAIESTVLVCRNEWKYVAELTLKLDPDLPLVLCVAGDFNQVILNLIVNAAHAIGDVVAATPDTKGRIEVSTQRNGEWAEIRVMDTGAGIPEDVRPSIFNPFFTTKAVGKGTGQGLAIAHNVVVQKHGGAITFETEIGVGTTFLVRLPMGADAAESAEDEAFTAQPARDNT
jgi:PAS domain S-box-containing protein